MSAAIPDLRGARVLVTGGLGFIGSALAARLARSGAEVAVIDALIPEHGGNRRNLDGSDGRIEIATADVRDEAALKRLAAGRDFLFNLAGQTCHMDSMADPWTDLDINARAQLSILEVCRRANPGVKIVFAGTRQVYGRPDSLPVGEDHPLRPVDVNGINKLAGERYHLLYNDVYGLRSCVLRLTNTYGPRMRVKDARQTFLGEWIRLALRGKTFEVWGGEQLRDFNYVDDVVDALLLAAGSVRANGRVYNLGGERAVPLAEVAALLIETAGAGAFKVAPFPEDRKSIDIGDYHADSTRIRSELGWSPRVSLREGLARTVEFFRERLEDYA
ncbi:MAG TPA: NAD-dependent epimerase/dehydratase family protein [Elusimicrobiota bacterium]|nr:NAD-dependent epimerase/dehydratase family protein [Elusimicrobiota bacterium]